MEPLIVDGVLESLNSIADYILAVAHQAELNKKKTYKLRLAVDELTTNIILYGYQNNQQKGFIKLQSQLEKGRLKIIIEDSSPPFNPENNLLITTQSLDQPLEERPIGGLGIYLALDGVDDFIYERDNDLNRMTLVVNH